jgi:uncharacterized protein (TIGR03437 family)
MQPLPLVFGLFVNVLTYQYSNVRTGANLDETILTPANVNATQFGKLFSQPVDGVLYGQPLYVAGVAIPGRGTHNVVYVATEHDSVYAFDADASMPPLWQVSFLNPNAGITTVPASDTNCTQIVPEIGVTSTPVIDAEAGTIYVVAMTKESGNYVQRLHALDITTGAERSGSPVVIQASVPGTGEGGSTVVFQPHNYKQRPGLLLLNGVVYTLWSSHCDIGVYHGWIMGYDEQTLQQVAVFNDTPNGNEASFWQGGAAPAVDQQNNMYVVAANGTFDAASGGPDYGEAYLKLQTDGGLSVADYFAPFNDAMLNDDDLDTGSAAVTLLGDEAGSSAHPHLMAGAGKQGRIYLLDRDHLGGFNAANDSQIVQSISGAVQPVFGNPAYFDLQLYFCGSGDQLKAFAVSNAQMTVTASSQSPEQFGFPGCVPTISANGSSSGIAWVLDPAGVLRAYNATNLGVELYNSNQNASRDSLGGTVKFSVPTVVNGKVYAGTQAALVVYGPLAQGIAFTVANAASGGGAVAPGSIASLFGTGLPAFPAITVNGLPAPILSATSSQVNLQIPFEVSPGAAIVNLVENGSVAGTTTIQVQSVAPGLFVQSNGNAAVLNQDESVNSSSQPAAVGTIIAAFLTGLGPVQPALATGATAPLNPLSRTTDTVTATLGGMAAIVEFAGLAPGYAGLYQVNVLAPQVASGQQPLQISVNEVSSNTAPVSIR